MEWMGSKCLIFIVSCQTVSTGHYHHYHQTLHHHHPFRHHQHQHHLHKINYYLLTLIMEKWFRKNWCWKMEKQLIQMTIRRTNKFYLQVIQFSLTNSHSFIPSFHYLISSSHYSIPSFHYTFQEPNYC